MIIDDVVAYAVGRSHHIACLPIGKSRCETGPQIIIRQRDRDAGGTALPDTHQPHAIETKIGYFVPVAIRNRSKIDSSSFLVADCLKPRPGVDLVDKRLSDLVKS
jgi:hypothetical protein